MQSYSKTICCRSNINCCVKNRHTNAILSRFIGKYCNVFDKKSQMKQDDLIGTCQRKQDGIIEKTVRHKNMKNNGEKNMVMKCLFDGAEQKI